MIGYFIKSRFNKYVSSRPSISSVGEVELFNDFKKSLDATVVGSRTTIIHKEKIYFSSIKHFNYKANQRCELGDLRIVFFSKKLNQVRDTVMQCKYEKNNKILLKSRFNCQMNQLHLLSYKLPYKKKLKSSIYSYELQKSKFHTKTSYGVFYKNGGSFDMICVSAPHISPLNTKAKSNIRQAQINCHINQIDFNEYGYEVLRVDNLIQFGTLIDNMMFGEKLIMHSECEDILAMIANLKLGNLEFMENEDEDIFDIPMIIFGNDIRQNWFNIYAEKKTSGLPLIFVNVDKLRDKSLNLFE